VLHQGWKRFARKNLKTVSAVVDSVYHTEDKFDMATAEIWLVENLLSVQKLLVTAKFDAHCDGLTGVGGELNLVDLPRYMICLWCFCQEFAARSNEIHDKFFEQVFDFDSDDEEKDVTVTDFLNVCPTSQRAACVKATDSLIEKYCK
jgi:hypothetical protein